MKAGMLAQIFFQRIQLRAVSVIMPKTKVLSPCVKSPAAAVGKEGCQWSEVTKRKGQASTGIKAANWEAGAVKTVCSRRKDGWGL